MKLPGVANLMVAETAMEPGISTETMRTEISSHVIPVVELACVVSPQEGDAHRGGQAYRYLEKAHAVRLNDQVMLSGVPTPHALGDSSGGGCIGDALKKAAGMKRPSGASYGSKLRETVMLIAAVTTPPARDWKDTAGMQESGVDPDGSTRSRLDQLPRQAQLAVSGGGQIGGTGATASIGQLDPAYSRWLQGLPPVFCDCAVTAMQSVRSRRRHSSARTGK